MSRMSRMNRMMSTLLLAALLLVGAVSPAGAQTVWDGPPLQHGNLDGIDTLSPSVQLARGDRFALFNPVVEVGYGIGSPSGTRWAFEGLQGNPTGAAFSATAFASLNFDSFVAALGKVGTTIRNRPGVLHLIAEDVYLDIEFERWDSRTLGAGYTYTRATDTVPEPTATGLLLLGLLALCRLREV